MAHDLLVKQLLLGSMQNFTYVVGDKQAKAAFVIDPSGPWHDIALPLKEEGLELKGILLTHGHYDHVVGVDKVDVPVYLSKKEAIFYTPHARELIRTGNGEKIDLGMFSLECLHTPGHAPGCQCFLVDGNLFTGDTLFMEAVGRTDFPGGDAKAMFESLQLIKRLPDATEVWPGHHYGQLMHASLSQVKKRNQFLACDDKDQFVNSFG